MSGAMAAGAIGMTQMALTCRSWIHCWICCTWVWTSNFGSATVTLIPALRPAAVSAFAVSCSPGMFSDSTEKPSLIGWPAASAVLPGASPFVPGDDDAAELDGAELDGAGELPLDPELQAA